MIAIIITAVLLSRTTFGRSLYAIGNNELAARFSGIPVRRNKLLIYTLSGFMAGLAGYILVSRVSTTRSDMGSGWEMDAIADKHSFPGYTVGISSKGCFNFSTGKITDYESFQKYQNGALSELAWLYNFNRGVLMAPGREEEWTLSIQHTDEDIDRYVAAFELIDYVVIDPNATPIENIKIIKPDLLAKGYWSHYEPSGRSPFQRALECGYPSQNIGENLAISGSAAGAMTLWKSSPTHNANMLNSRWVVVGIGYAGGYWAMALGAVDDSGTAATTTVTATASPTPTPTPGPGQPSQIPIKRATLQMIAAE